MRLPALVAHADWSVDPSKRWCALATLRSDGSYRAFTPRLVDPLESICGCLEDEAGDGPVLLGFDFPIGIPSAYAAQAGITDFRAALVGTFDECFYRVAEQQGEISLKRPFYPMRPGGRSREQLRKGLGLKAWSDLLRRCDRPSASRPAACALFWTLGGQQVGKAAIVGWRDLLAPALRKGLDLAIWPFEGGLDELLTRHRTVVAETYPAEFYRHLGLNLKGGKGEQAVRRSNAPRLLAWANGAGLELAPAMVAEIADGFGAGAGGDDRFDAMVGLFGMLNVVLGQRAPGEPDDPAVRRVEGWILGQETAG